MGFNTGFVDGTTDLGQTSTFVNKAPFSVGQIWVTGTNLYYISSLTEYYSGTLTLGNFYRAISSPVQISTGGINWKSIQIGPTQAAGIKSDGTLWTWGLNYFGNLGTNNITDRYSPGQTVSATTNWKQVSMNQTTVGTVMGAIKTDGTLWTWGSNAYFGLGIPGVDRSSPVQVLGSWKHVSHSQYGFHAIKTDGTLWFCGYSTNGSSGDPLVTTTSTPSQIGTGNDWSKVISGTYSGKALKTDGTLWTWGQSRFGDTGAADTTIYTTPTNLIDGTWKDIVGTYGNTSGIKADGTLWSWGSNSYGQLGDGTTVSTSSPVQILGGGTWLKAGIGSGIKTDGTLWVWGSNSYGQLGDGTTAHKSSPIQILSNYKFSFVTEGYADPTQAARAFISDIN